jgi:hypothetical protein
MLSIKIFPKNFFEINDFLNKKKLWKYFSEIKIPFLFFAQLLVKRQPTTIILKRMGRNITDSVLRSYFGKFGRVAMVKVIF